MNLQTHQHADEYANAGRPNRHADQYPDTGADRATSLRHLLFK
jgi:hypothetical protein